jgi:ankyrin repeat protein
LLILGGADVNIGGGIFGSLLHLATIQQKTTIIDSLVNRNVDLNKQDYEGNTPIHLIMNIFSKNPEKCSHTLDLFVNNGAKVNKKNGDNWTPLHTAVRKCQELAVKAITKHIHHNNYQKSLGKKVSNQFDIDLGGGTSEWTALHLAALSSQLNILVELAKAGANIFHRNISNLLPRHCARGNFITTKTIKQIEQKQIRAMLKVY